MSDDLRREAASLARAVRRKVERERALGGGDLLASGVARAKGAGERLARPVPSAAPEAEREPLAVSAPAAAGFTPTPPVEAPRAPKRAANRDAAADDEPAI